MNSIIIWSKSKYPKAFEAQNKMHFSRYKDDFMKLLDEKAPAFGIKNLKMVSFSAQRGYGYKYTATDVAVAVNAILELSGRKDPELNFHTGSLSSLKSENNQSYL